MWEWRKLHKECLHANIVRVIKAKRAIEAEHVKFVRRNKKYRIHKYEQCQEKRSLGRSRHR
jgi:hypothetical protein